MDTDRIRAALLAAIAEVAPETDPSRLRGNLPLRAQVDLDSIDWLNVAARLSERLGVEIAEPDASRQATLDAVVARIAALAAQPRAAGPAQDDLSPTRHRVNDTGVTIRPIRADDLQREADFVRRLSLEARYDRFMVTVRELSPVKLRYLTAVDQVRHVALAATTQQGGVEVIVGVARYVVDPDDTTCEFAIAVDDSWHGTGLAGVLMQRLIEVARARGLRTMEGFVLAANTRMLRFTGRLGFSVRHDSDGRDTVRVVRPL